MDTKYIRPEDVYEKHFGEIPEIEYRHRDKGPINYEDQSYDREDTVAEIPGGTEYMLLVFLFGDEETMEKMEEAYKKEGFKVHLLKRRKPKYSIRKSMSPQLFVWED